MERKERGKGKKNKAKTQNMVKITNTEKKKRIQKVERGRYR